jgi:glucosamine 6-phosphate synthetase-like amidotransferase/phosphosugar isomerase protein
MCGIIGYSTPKPINPAIIKALLLMAQNRGGDATGIASHDKVIKKAVTARKFIESLDVPETTTLIGHTRLGTVGSKVLDENAHPFKYGDIVGAHNGGISNYYDIGKKYEVSFNVDSMAAFYLINRNGFEKALPELKGSFALSWIDKEQNLNLYRHSNPIYIGEYREGIVFGSEERYLQVIGANSIFSIPEHTLFVFKDGALLKREDVPYNEVKQTHTAHQSSKRANYVSSAPKEALWYREKDEIVRYWKTPHGQSVAVEFNIMDTVDRRVKYVLTYYNLASATDLLELEEDFPTVFKSLIS